MEKVGAAVGRALVVDDEPDSRFVIGALMKSRLHCDVTLAGSVSQALAFYDTEQFDIIVSDYEMPSRNGLDFARELSERNCAVPFLIYSARDISKWELAKLNLVADTVTKPNLEDLFSIISVLLDWPLELKSWADRTYRATEWSGMSDTIDDKQKPGGLL